MNGVLTSLVLFVALFGNVYGQAVCNFQQSLKPGWRYEISNDGYPQKYVAGSSCRWVAMTEGDGRVKLTCNHFDIPYSNGCQFDRLEIRDGYEILPPFCGGPVLNYTSKSSQLTLNLITYVGSPRGSLRCTIEVIRPTPCNCGIRNAPKIYGGEQTAEHEYPFMAAIIDISTRELVCGGTIINKMQVLTAAHCLWNRKPHQLVVLVGAHDLKRVEKTPGAKVLGIANFISHPGYDRSTSDYDIALITVREPFKFNEIISPVCLPFQRPMDSFSNPYTDILGWGADSIVGGPLNVLMRATVGITTPNVCRYMYPTSTERQICTQDPYRDSCGFDSGGPLTIQNAVTRRVVQIGIINKGPSCGAGQTALNLRVGALLDWIVRSSVRGVTYCTSE